MLAQFPTMPQLYSNFFGAALQFPSYLFMQAPVPQQMPAATTFAQQTMPQPMQTMQQQHPQVIWGALPQITLPQ